MNDQIPSGQARRLVSTGRASWTADLRAGFIVFLIALPLSIGIALASGAPPTAGVLAAIIGGVLGSLVTGAHLTINGPAAGLIVIVMGAIHDLGGDPMEGFKRMLAALVCAGILQIIFGVFRLGAIGLAVPGSVIHGMLTGIGVIIMVKQLPVALGVIPTAKTLPDMILAIPHTLEALNPEVALIAMVGFYIILYMSRDSNKIARFVPAPLLVIVAGIVMAHLFDFEHEHLVESHWLHFTADERLLLNLPKNLTTAIFLPDFSRWLTPKFWIYVVELAMVGSIESLLSAAAVDRMDPFKRTTNLDRELIGKGVCNVVCGLIGGLPIIAEMVRSTANIQNGAITRRANFFHGIFILLALVFIPHLLHLIPLAALAAILMSVGYSLAHPRQFLKTAQIGPEHFSAFIVTFAVTIMSDLLLGVIAGILVELVVNVTRGASIKSIFKADIHEHDHPEAKTLTITSALVFTNYLSFKKQMEKYLQADQSSVRIDLRLAHVIDHTVLEQLHRMSQESKRTGSGFELVFSNLHTPVSKHPLAARRLPRDSIASYREEK